MGIRESVPGGDVYGSTCKTSLDDEQSRRGRVRVGDSGIACWGMADGGGGVGDAGRQQGIEAIVGLLMLVVIGVLVLVLAAGWYISGLDRRY